MKLFPIKKLAKAPKIVDELLESVGRADPSIDIKITAAITKDLDIKGSRTWEPDLVLDLPIEGISLDAELQARLIREFARNGMGLILVEIERKAKDTTWDPSWPWGHLNSESTTSGE